jgi:hypothetical protein
VIKRRWIPWLFLAGLGILTLGIVALALTGTSARSVTPAELTRELSKPIGLGANWALQEAPRTQISRDTWNPSTCYSYSTTFGGPSAEASYDNDGSGLPYFQEAILIPSVAPNEIIDMLASCGDPKGPLPPAYRRGKITFLHTAPLPVFDGLGNGSLAVISHPQGAGLAKNQINAYIALGDELVRFSYIGRASPSAVRTAVAISLSRAVPYS